MKQPPHSDITNLRCFIYDVTVAATWQQNFLRMRGGHKMPLLPHTAYSYQGWLDIYCRYISLIHIGYISDIFVQKYRIFSIFIEFKKFFLMWHIGTTFWFSVCVLLAYDLCPQHFLSVGQLLSDFTSPQQCSVNDKSTSPNMQCTHTHILLLFGSKFHIILAMYVQMLDICIENIGYFRYFRKYHNIFQPRFLYTITA